MGIWWAAGFSTAAIRIIDDDARGRSDLWDFPLLAAHRPMFLMASGLPMDGGDVQVNKFIRILRSERRFLPWDTQKLSTWKLDEIGNCPFPDSFVLLLVLLARLHDGLALAHTLSCIGLFIRHVRDWALNWFWFDQELLSQDGSGLWRSSLQDLRKLHCAKNWNCRHKLEQLNVSCHGLVD